MVTLVRAPNPSPMTLSGTNTYLVDCGDGQAIAIDPGPAIASHVEAIVEAARDRGLTIAAIALTHGHPDHAPAAGALAARTGAPVYAHPACAAHHDRDLEPGSDLRVGSVALLAIDAPGHTFDHLVFFLPAQAALFTGDVILGEGTVIAAPPEGDMRAYQRTLQRLADEFPHARVIYPGHGPAIRDPRAKIAEYIEHRRMRDRQVLESLADGPRTADDLIDCLYGTDRPSLRAAMLAQVHAHLAALQHEGRVSADGARYRLTPSATKRS